MFMNNLKLTVSIVNFNAGEYLSSCLKSLEKIKQEVDFKVIVVDNSSSDDSLQSAKLKFPWIKFIESSENLGFGKANNLVLKNLDTEYILILNPDTEIGKNVLNVMLDFMDKNPDVGAASCKVILDNGKIDWASHRGFPTPLASLLYFLGNGSLYHLSNKFMEETHEVDSISGAFFLTKKSVLKKVSPPVGGFDEDYFMYGEDLDLSFRIKQAGFKIMYVPEVSIIHHKGVSSGLKAATQKITTASLETRIRALDSFYMAMAIFYRKHYSQNHLIFMNWLVNLGINIKWWLAKRKLVV